MPNRPFHIATSTPVGAGYACYKSSNQNELARVLESLGGALGGYCGGVLPDLIDPPFHPGHRSIGHGVYPVLTAATIWQQGIDGWQQHGRQLADQHAVHRSQATDPLVAVWHAAMEWALRLLAGFVAGIGAGYLSHVALDFGTPRCLPLIS